MTLRENLGLSQRLLILGILTTLALMAGGGYLLRDRLHNTILRSMAATLNERADRLASSLRAGDSGHIYHDPALAPEEYRTIFSGWYWQLDDGQNHKHSRSLWDSSLNPENASRISRDPALYRLTGPTGEPLLGIKREQTLGGRTITLHTYGPAQATNTELSRLDSILILMLMGMIITLLLSLWLQIHLGLTPLRRLHHALRAIHSGEQTRVGTGYGPDLDPLAREIDDMLERNARIVARARGHAADLSHALKKPLALLGSEAHNEHTRQHIDNMNRLIERHLARAGSGAGDMRRIDLAASLAQLTALMRRLHAARNLDWQLHTDGDLHLRAEQTDLEEMLGNLLDNAGKWAASRVRTEARHLADAKRGHIQITIEDDGPGLTDEQIARVPRRGERFDQSTAGSGLGLAIVADLAETYDGSLELGRSALGGLQITLRLPC